MKKSYIILFLLFIFMFVGCTNVTLQNGKSSVTFRGMKIFSPTVLSLQDGNCQVPSVDAGGLIQTPIITVASTTESCHTAVMTVNGVDLKGLANIIMTAILGGLAAS